MARPGGRSASEAFGAFDQVEDDLTATVAVMQRRAPRRCRRDWQAAIRAGLLRKRGECSGVSILAYCG